MTYFQLVILEALVVESIMTSAVRNCGRGAAGYTSLEHWWAILTLEHMLTFTRKRGAYIDFYYTILLWRLLQSLQSFQVFIKLNKMKLTIGCLLCTVPSHTSTFPHNLNVSLTFIRFSSFRNLYFNFFPLWLVSSKSYFPYVIIIFISSCSPELHSS